MKWNRQFSDVMILGRKKAGYGLTGTWVVEGAFGATLKRRHNMARKLKLMPGRMSRGLLRLIGMAITFLFTWFVYASGQIITAAGKSASAARMQPLIPAYGDVEKGMLSSQFSVKGTIKSWLDGSGIGNARITLRDTAAKQIVDSTITSADGAFFMTFLQPGLFVNIWLLGARANNFFGKDTLISISGGDTVNVNLILDWAVPVYGCPPPPAKFGILNMSAQAWRANGVIEMRYSLPTQGQAHMALYNANGSLAREIFERYESAGQHEVRVETSGLSAGIYFLKFQVGAQVAITKITIER
jgi:hypothetical protein